MELWIRSQDKNYLIPIKDVISIFSSSLFYQNIILGTYKTKERALEILDEIQEKVCPIGMVNLSEYAIVYEMPKE